MQIVTRSFHDDRHFTQPSKYGVRRGANYIRDLKIAAHRRGRAFSQALTRALVAEYHDPSPRGSVEPTFQPVTGWDIC